MIEYDPGEFTFTALASTPLASIVEELGRAGQYLPFDPMFVDSGITLGGLIATGMNGPGRLRFGGMRDFILGIEWTDGKGRVLRSGGKVVKNSAGFDFPKLMVGSFGRLGHINEATFKVFPRPESVLTVSHDAADLPAAIMLAGRIAAGPFDADAVEVLPRGRVIVRLAGHSEALSPRLHEMRRKLASAFDVMEGAELFWVDCLSWSRSPSEFLQVKVAVTPSKVSELDDALAAARAPRRYSVACNVAFVDWPVAHGIDDLDRLLCAQKLHGLCLDHPRLFIGRHPGLEFLQRVKRVLDPQNRLGDFK